MIDRYGGLIVSSYSFVGAGKSEIRRESQETGNSGRNSCFSLEAEFLLLETSVSLSQLLLRHLTDCMRPTYIIKGTLLYLMSPDYRCC